MTTKSGRYRFTVKETARGTFWLSSVNQPSPKALVRVGNQSDVAGILP